MAKRRRERDRPKSNNEAPYNPYKRVLLSYDSDDESMKSSPSPEPGPRIDRSQRPLETSPEAVTMQDTAGHHNTKVDGMTDQQTGQRAMLQVSSLSDGDSDDGHDSATVDAMAYLLSVQSERQGIPTILTAKHHEINVQVENDAGLDEDRKGHYTDGAYVARPLCGPVKPTEDRYMSSVLHGYEGVRELLQQPVTEEERLGADETIFIFEVPRDNKEFVKCMRLLRDTVPSIAQFKKMTCKTAWDLLFIVLRRFYLRRGQALQQKTAWWLYMLLARLEEPIMWRDNAMFDLRVTVREAVAMRDSLRSESAQRVNETKSDVVSQQHAPSPSTELKYGEGVENGTGVNIGVKIENNAEVKQVNLVDHKADLEDDTMLQQNSVTETAVDTMLVIVGYYFGQRDLLELRSLPAT